MIMLPATRLFFLLLACASLTVTCTSAINLGTGPTQARIVALGKTADEVSATPAAAPVVQVSLVELDKHKQAPRQANKSVGTYVTFSSNKRVQLRSIRYSEDENNPAAANKDRDDKDEFPIQFRVSMKLTYAGADYCYTAVVKWPQMPQGSPVPMVRGYC